MSSTDDLRARAAHEPAPGVDPLLALIATATDFDDLQATARELIVARMADNLVRDAERATREASTP